MFRVFSGLRSRLLAIMLLALVPATALLFVYAAGQNRLAEQRARDDVKRLVESDARALQDLIGESRATLVAYAASQAVQRSEWKVAQATAERIKAEQSQYVNVGVVVPSGRVVVSALPTSGTVDVSDRSYFLRAMRYRRFVVGDFQVGRISMRPSFNVAYPVLDPDGSVRAIVFVSFDVTQVRARMAGSPAPYLTEYLLDAGGRVIVREPDIRGGSGSLAGAPLMQAILKESSGSVPAQAGDGELLEYAYRPVFQEPDGGLFIAIGFSPTQLFAPERQNLWMTLAGFAVVAVAALTSAWAAGTRWVYTPTLRLKEAATRIGRGHLSTRAHLATGIEEFTALGKQFDAMAESIERRVTMSHALAEVNKIAHSTLEFDEVMQRIISVTCDAVGAETAAMVLREHGVWCTKYSYNYPTEILGVILTDEQAPHAAMALETRQPVAIDDAFNDPRLNSDVMRGYGIRSVLTMPLVVQDEVIGVVFMNHHAQAVAFTPAQVTFVSSVATTVALALHNARLYEGEHRIAQKLQQSLLALPASIPHLSFSRVYRSATEAAQVGGDFYDLFELEHGLVGVTIGDVSGKGLDAAVLTSMVKNTIRAQATDMAKTPADVMRTANIVLLRESSPEVFATVFFGVLDTTTGRLSYCNAGHTAAVLRQPQGQVLALPSNSMLVGGLPDAEFDNAEALLEPGGLLFLYTDGVTEARSASGLFGTKRILDLVEGLEGGDPWVAAARVAQSAAAFADGHLSDDLAILAVELADR